MVPFPSFHDSPPDSSEASAFSALDKTLMRRALALARKGWGRTFPNPMVGCVVARDSKVITEGFHRCFGEAHAEAAALETCEESLAGATMYVTLEPCNHHGKTKPCTEAILNSSIKRVVIAALDPNPVASG